MSESGLLSTARGAPHSECTETLGSCEDLAHWEQRSIANLALISVPNRSGAL